MENVTGEYTALPVHFAHPAFVYIRTIGACAFAIVGFPLNLTALVVIFKSDRTMTTHGHLLTYLCVVESLICIYALPVLAYDQWTMVGLHHPVFCKLSVYIYFALQGNVPIAFLLIALHRFLLVVQPVPALANLGGAFGTSGCIIGGVSLVLITLVPPLFDAGALFRRSSITGICTSLIRPHTKMYNSITQGLILFIPLILMSACYGFILRTIRVQNTRIMAAARTGVLNHPDVRESMRRRRYTIRVTLLSAISVIIFVVSYTPFILGTLFPWKLDTYLYSAITTVITFSHTVTSPLLYVCGDSEMRMTFVRLVPCRCRGDDVSTEVTPVESIYIPPDSMASYIELSTRSEVKDSNTDDTDAVLSDIAIHKNNMADKVVAEKVNGDKVKGRGTKSGSGFDVIEDITEHI